MVFDWVASNSRKNWVCRPCLGLTVREKNWSELTPLLPPSTRLLACVVAIARAQHLIGDCLTAGFTIFTAGILVNGVSMGLGCRAQHGHGPNLRMQRARVTARWFRVYLGCILGLLCYFMGFSKFSEHVAWRVAATSGVAILMLIGASTL
ncbi:unnamed protein product [Urochloa humidicola]